MKMLQFIGILSLFLLMFQFPKCDSQEYRRSVNVMNSGTEKSFDHYQEVAKIVVDKINVKLPDGNTYVRQLQFKMFGASLNVFLRRHSLFHKDMLLSVDDTSLETFGTRKYLPVLYTGNLDNSEDSTVYAKITGEKFELTIHNGNITFSVECPCDGSDSSKSIFQYLVYPLQNCRAYRWQNLKLQNLVNLQNPGEICASHSHKHKQFLLKTMPVNTDIYEEENRYRRSKREIVSSGITGNCVLKLVADHLYFEHVGKGDISKTIAEMVTSLAEADIIFRQTDFDGDGTGDNIGFKIGNITIYRNDQNYKMKDENFGAYEYLDKFSEYDFSEYCLGLAYTYRDFEDSTVGLAWLGNSNSNGAAGGICQRRLWYRPDMKYYSFNTALITQLSHGNFISSYRSGLILAHEFGHSFGSSHDTQSNAVCSPEGNFGNFLMHPYTNDGSLANHRRFSPCSINSIYPVLVNKSPLCFMEDLGPVCGNGILEYGEECDCGSVDMCSEMDPCCTPENNSALISDLPCTIRRSQGYQCSPKTSACCTETCMYHTSSDLPQCRKMTECTSASVCEHGSFSCPDAVPHPDGTICDSGRKICNQGRCYTSICRSLGLLECQCSNVLTDACYVCCVAPNVSSDCTPISRYSSNLRDMLKQKGEACYNFRGFCDEAGVCVLKESSSLDGLNKLLSGETAVNLGVWLKKYWYYIIIGIIFSTALAVIVSVFFRPKRDVHIDAMRLGKLTAVLAQAENQKTIYRDKMDDIEVAFQKIIDQTKTQQCPMSLTQAVARLSVFFPTAPLSLLMKSVQSSSSEDFVVKMLLVRGYPIQKFSISLQRTDEKSPMDEKSP